MQLRLTCEVCGSLTAPRGIDSGSAETATASCPKGHSVSYRLTKALREKGEWELCPRCQAPDAYVQKAVSKRWMLVGLVPVLGAAFYLLSVNWYAGIALLVSLAALDGILYRTLPNLLVCYGCGS